MRARKAAKIILRAILEQEDLEDFKFEIGEIHEICSGFCDTFNVPKVTRVKGFVFKKLGLSNCFGAF